MLLTPAVLPTPTLLPSWDGLNRVLSLGEQIVKEYRVPSPNQEAVLTTFQEEGWPHYVYDPLIPLAKSEQCPKFRLRDTIKCLNANQKNPLIRFRGDGTGERVGWEAVEVVSLSINRARQSHSRRPSSRAA